MGRGRDEWEGRGGGEGLGEICIGGDGWDWDKGSEGEDWDRGGEETPLV